MESKKYKDISLGLGFLLMKTETNELYSIGDNRQGQCGTPDTLTNQVSSPRHIPFKNDISSMSTGLQFSVVLDSSHPLSRPVQSVRLRPAQLEAVPADRHGQGER